MLSLNCLSEALQGGTASLGRREPGIPERLSSINTRERVHSFPVDC